MNRHALFDKLSDVVGSGLVGGQPFFAITGKQ